ncbi:MAG: hypothetical protein V5A72_02980 [Candidatus Nanohaloarchaea archaeon]
MSMSLDMIGKFILITIILAVVTGLILSFETDISSSVNDILGGDDSSTDSEVVTISSSTPSSKIASLVDSCYQRYLENSYEDYVCFIARSDSGSFSFDEDDVDSKLSENVKKKADISSVTDATTVIVRYSKTSGKIVVDQ